MCCALNGKTEKIEIFSFVWNYTCLFFFISSSYRLFYFVPPRLAETTYKQPEPHVSVAAGHFYPQVTSARRVPGKPGNRATRLLRCRNALCSGDLGISMSWPKMRSRPKTPKLQGESRWLLSQQDGKEGRKGGQRDQAER